MRPNFSSSLRRNMIRGSIGAVGLLAASISGCGGGGGSTPVINPPPGTRSACAVNPAHNDGRARWTVLVYMNASNNLQPFSLQNIAQMVNQGSDSNVNIVVQWKQAAQSQITDCSDCVPSFVGTRRYLLHQHDTSSLCTNIDNFATCSTSEPTILAGDRLADPTTNIIDPATNASTSDMGDYRVLNSFVKFGLNAYPADNYALVIWDHGSGWRPVYRSAHTKQSTRAVSQDEQTGNEIETQEIATALTGLPHPLDMVILDCSLEGMAEVAYQIRNTARTMVCSEESPPGAGYPYHKWLAALKSSGKNPCELGTSIAQTFAAYYPSMSNVTQSVIDLSKMDTVATNLNALGAQLYADRQAESALIKSARNTSNVQAYGQEDPSLYGGFIDLFGYADNIRKGTSKSAVSTAAANLQTSLTDPVTGAVVFSIFGPGKSGSNGLSIYVPDPGNYLSAYNALGLSAAAPSWPQFLQAQVQ